MAEYNHPVSTGNNKKQHQPVDIYEAAYIPYWARSHVKYAQNLLDDSDEPIEYDHDDEDYQDNCFFFPEDCSWSPPKNWVIEETKSIHELSDLSDGDCYDDDKMIPGLPDIKMLDAEALSDLLEDNLSPPEITTILVFATNGAIFAYASSLPTRRLRNLSATYGAAYTCYAKNASSGNLTGVNPASHPSSYVTAQSVSLGDVGSIVFELDDQVAVVTRIADKVLLAAVGPSKLASSENGSATNDAQVANGSIKSGADGSVSADAVSNGLRTPVNGNRSAHQTPVNTSPNSVNTQSSDGHLETQYEIDRSTDLARLASLNLSASPSILLALESKSAALGKFLSQKLEDLESPEDF